MNIINIIEKKKRKGSLTLEEINFVVDGFLDKKITDYQMSSFLMTICLNGMNLKEIANLTSCYIASGQTLDLSCLNIDIVDKHSTGGIGDKVTLIILPLVACCRVGVAKMSGKSLGITGGTIDKLSSISEFRLNLSHQEFINQIKEISMAITTTSENLVPADKLIYELRDLTGTTDSIGLITASILSKKIAAGSKKIVIDVKYGIASFMKTYKEACLLAKTMVKVGEKLGVKVVCVITDMNFPLGKKVGNSLEIEEAVDTLLNNGPKDLTEVCIYIASTMVSIGKNISFKQAKKEVTKNLINHNAYQKFVEMIEFQGGNLDQMKKSDYIYQIKANKNGYIGGINIDKYREFGQLLKMMRLNKGDEIDYTSGFEFKKSYGQKVKVGDIILAVHSNKKQEDFEKFADLVIIKKSVLPRKLIKKVIK